MARLAILALLVVAALVLADPRERVGRAFYEAGFPSLAAFLLEGPTWRGATLYAQGRFDAAAAAFAVAAFPAADYDRGTALARAGRLKEAEAALNEALYRDPNDEDARYNLALVESLREKRKGAGEDAMNPANASATKQKRGGEAPSSEENQVNSTGDGAAGDRESGAQAESPGGAQISRAGRARQSVIHETDGARGSVGAAEGRGRTGGDNSKVARSFDDAIKLPKKSYSQQAVQPSLQWLQTIPDDPGKYLRLKLAAERVNRSGRGVAAPQGTDPW